MSIKGDTKPVIKVDTANADELRKIGTTMEARTHIKTSFVKLANAAMALGLPELKKQNGGGK